MSFEQGLCSFAIKAIQMNPGLIPLQKALKIESFNGNNLIIHFRFSLCPVAIFCLPSSYDTRLHEVACSRLDDILFNSSDCKND